MMGVPSPLGEPAWLPTACLPACQLPANCIDFD
jgi:hypothetical protein